ncbi:thiamine phosphate synthase [Fulvivirgaceae bacterium BMA10]|uniref:Thiamine-phosphate synthase n=1 Tax=Splendidivirga corallicola TaxID=3051826 RepID=A0ABT8KPL7_9BACT|nr:thiamine phosphate synthase [Fulvivirgaceae bacterium BMA10]
MISQLHYITQSTPSYRHLDTVKDVCEAGCKWIQLRMKHESPEERMDIATTAKGICTKHQAKLIINDHVDLTKAVKADGVHLGKTDMSPEEARKVLGDKFIIGGTANTLDDILHLYHTHAVDYIGLGPFRYTKTKENLSPILASEGYAKILEQLRKQHVKLPIVAIGGIRLNDIQSIMRLGLDGIAVSSLITFSDDKKRLIENIEEEINHGTATYRG